MARTRRPEPPKPPSAIIASARRMPSSPKPSTTVGAQGWQEEVYRLYRMVPEFRAGITWIANVVSRARLFATIDTGDGPVPVEPGSPADDVLDEFFDGKQGQAQALRNVALHYGLAGEAWIVGYEDGKGGTVWGVHPVTAIGARGGDWSINGKPIPGKATIIRIWSPDPRDENKADSPSRSVLSVLREITLLDAHLHAALTSRLASAGLLLVPNELTTSISVGQDADGHQMLASGPQAITDALIDIAGRAIADRDDPAAIVPVALSGDGEHLDKVRHVTFWSELSATASDLREKAVRRLALGLDMPPEQLTGVGETSHWNAWQIDEASIKAHTEPLLERLVFDIAKGYLRPALEEQVEDTSQYGIGVDTTAMRLRPNRSKEALELFDRGELHGDVLRRETGFEDDDGLDDDGLKAWLLRKMASGSTTPEIVVKAAELLGVTGLEVAVVDAEPTEARPTPSLLEHPTRDAPDPIAAAGLLGLAEGLVYRALQRGGNRLRNRLSASRRPQVECKAMEFHQYVTMTDALADHALEDAWSDVGDLVGPYAVSNVSSLTEALNDYCRWLMLSGQPHSRVVLARHLEKVR